MKNVLKDEILYFFEEEYELYKNCINEIEQYTPGEKPSFWELIHRIIEFCINKNKLYYLIFDQYKNKIDKEGELFKINNNLKTKNKFCIIVCISLNDKDIRYYKVKKIFDSPKIKNEPDNMIIIEVEHLLDE